MVYPMLMYLPPGFSTNQDIAKWRLLHNFAIIIDINTKDSYNIIFYLLSYEHDVILYVYMIGMDDIDIQLGLFIQFF